MKINNEWLSAEMCEPDEGCLYLVECEDGYITTGSCDNGVWWVYDHSRKENHPTNNKVVKFAEIPNKGKFSA